MDWLLSHRIILQNMAVISLLVGVATLAAVVVVLVRLPEDYFVSEKRHALREEKGLGATVSVAAKNTLGVVMVFLGLFMLVLPGQGMLFILAGLFMTNFPGKFRMERAIIRNTLVSTAVNRVRGHFDRPPLMPPDETEPGERPTQG